MKLGPIIDRLVAAQIGLKAVEGVEQLADIATFASALPAAFVVPQGEDNRGGTNEGPGLIMLQMDVSFGVVIVVKAAAQRGRARDELTGLADAAVAALLGWTPSADVFRPIVPVSSRLLGLDSGRVSWLINLRTAYYLRKTP